MRKSGECYTLNLEQSIQKIDDECAILDTFPIVVIKSTIPPGTTERINKHTRLDVCFSPEFLTEANSFNDFKNQTRIIIGGPRPSTGTVKQMFRKAFPTIPIIKTGSNTAEMVKYFTNCFLATKVTFANEMYDICNAAKIDYDKVCEYAMYDTRIGKSHLAVPGPDGGRGFGGHCFPKDLAALVSFSKTSDVSPEFLETVQRLNDMFRDNKDWLDMKGRAVSDE
jgi:UDPglucose 6-dehydrogenase